MFEFSIRRLLRHWSLNLSVLLALTLGSALLASMPGYSNAAALWSLQQSFISHTSTERNIDISAAPDFMTGALNSYIIDTIGGIVKFRLTVQKATSLVNPARPIVPIDASNRLKINALDFWSYDRMSDIMTLVEGKWPKYSSPITQQEMQQAMTQRPIVQAAVSQAVAHESGIRIGDVLIDAMDMKYTIVGIVKQNDPASDIWWNDPSPFLVTVIPGTNEDKIIVPVIIDPIAFQDIFPQGYERHWRYLIDLGSLTPENSRLWEKGLLSLKTRLQADDATMISSLPDILLTFRTNQATIRMVLLLVGSQSFIFILFTLVLISSSVLERTQGEISTIVGRGASSWQLIKLLAIEGGYMVILVGVVLGPLVSWLVLNGWAKVTGSNLAFKVTPETLYFSLIGAGLEWVALIVGTIPIVRSSLLDWQRKLSRAKRSSSWSRLYLDIFLAIFAGVVFWQLSSNGSFVIRRISELPQADPLLLLSPTILLITLSLVLLRIFPYFLQGLSFLAKSMRSLVLPLGLSRLARNPVRQNQVILLIGAAFGMMLFMTTYDNSLGFNQGELAHYLAGADFRIAQGRFSLEDIRQLPGVNRASQVLRLQSSTNTGNILTILAVDTSTFTQVSGYPPDFSGIPMDSILQALHQEETPTEPDSGDGYVQNPYAGIPDRVIPAVLSKTALPTGKGIGDILQTQIRSVPVYLDVRGVIDNFPTLSRSFILVDLTSLLDYLNLQASIFSNYAEFWLETDPVRHDALVTSFMEHSKVLADAQTELIKIQNNAFTEGGRRAFILNAYTLAILSIAGFVLLNFFSAQQRLYEFGVLRANGMSIGQINALLILEGLLIIFLGILVGAGVGFGLVYTMRPFLNAALVKTYPQAVVYQIIVDWSRIGGLTAILLTVYLLAILAFMMILIKNGIHRMIKIGEE